MLAICSCVFLNSFELLNWCNARGCLCVIGRATCVQMFVCVPEHVGLVPHSISLSTCESNQSYGKH